MAANQKRRLQDEPPEALGTASDADQREPKPAPGKALHVAKAHGLEPHGLGLRQTGRTLGNVVWTILQLSVGTQTCQGHCARVCWHRPRPGQNVVERAEYAPRPSSKPLSKQASLSPWEDASCLHGSSDSEGLVLRSDSSWTPGVSDTCLPSSRHSNLCLTPGATGSTMPNYAVFADHGYLRPWPGRTRLSMKPPLSLHVRKSARQVPADAGAGKAVRSCRTPLT